MWQIDKAPNTSGKYWKPISIWKIWQTWADRKRFMQSRIQQHNFMNHTPPPAGGEALSKFRHCQKWLNIPHILPLIGSNAPVYKGLNVRSYSGIALDGNLWMHVMITLLWAHVLINLWMVCGCSVDTLVFVFAINYLCALHCTAFIGYWPYVHSYSISAFF